MPIGRTQPVLACGSPSDRRTGERLLWLRLKVVAMPPILPRQRAAVKMIVGLRRSPGEQLARVRNGCFLDEGVRFGFLGAFHLRQGSPTCGAMATRRWSKAVIEANGVHAHGVNEKRERATSFSF